MKTDLEGDGVRNWSDAAVIQRTLNRDSYYQKLESKEGFHPESEHGSTDILTGDFQPLELRGNTFHCSKPPQCVVSCYSSLRGKNKTQKQETK